jgi:hypothetical protein
VDNPVAKEGALKVSILIETEQRVVTCAFKVGIVSGAFPTGIICEKVEDSS